MTQEIRNYFDGLLLGDGCYSFRKTSTRYSFGQIIDHQDWVNHQIIFFNTNNIENNSCIIPGGKKIILEKECNTKDKIHLSTLGYTTFNEEYKRWYPENKKIIPKDINITSPILLANWHMGDGCVVKRNNGNRIKLCLSTNGFSFDDVNWIISELYNKLYIKSYIHISVNKQPEILMNHNNALSFIKIIKNYVVPSFNYKIPNDPTKLIHCTVCNEIIHRGYNSKFCNSCYITYSKHHY